MTEVAYDETWLAKLPTQTLPEASRRLPLHEQFHKQARLTPKNIAVVDDHRMLTYEELNFRVLVLGEHLRTNFDIGLDVPVGIYMEPSVNYVISFLSAMSAGGCFVTIENAYPVDMIRAVCSDAKVGVVLTTRAMALRLQAVDVPVFIVDHNFDTVTALVEETDVSVQELEERRLAAPCATLDNLAFMVYSSGTTGKPKGIANPHRAPVMSYQWRWGLSESGDRVACNVFYIWEAIRPLLRGAATYSIRPDQIYDGPALCSFVERHKITEILFTPTLLQNLLVQTSPKTVKEKMESVNTVYLNGEVLSRELAQKAIKTLPHVRFINLYSISECHEIASVDISLLDYEKEPTGFCPVGYPSPLTPPYILDEDMKKVKDGEPGELYVSGPLLAREYLNMPDTTASRFPENPYTEDHVQGGDCRMYRTGDRARMLPNGMLEVLGRCAFMVKIRGYSVVLGAIEHALVNYVALKSCAVIADGAEGSEKRLVAFVVRLAGQSQANEPVDESGKPKLMDFTIDQSTGICLDIQKKMAANLPHYMVPSVYIELDSLPLHLVSGKLDTGKLAKLAKVQREVTNDPNESDRHKRKYQNTRLDALKNSFKYMNIPAGSNITDVEFSLLCAWEGILTLPFGTVFLDDDFVSLGGHSLSASRLTATIENMYKVRLPVSKVLEGITAREQALAIVNAWNVKEGSPGSSPPTTGAAALLRKVLASAVVPKFEALPIENQGSVSQLKDCKQVFLTGGTGYFGAFLLSELLMAGVENVVCLVRKRSDKFGVEILQENLQSYGLLRPLGDKMKRVTAVFGDLTKKGLGVTGLEDAAALIRCDGIVHCAAAVSLVSGFESLALANIQGTKEVMQLALKIKQESGSSPCGVFISTNGIIPLERVKMVDALPLSPAMVNFENLPHQIIYGRDGSVDEDLISSMSNGYGLTKWAAEKIVTDTSSKFGLNFSTFRMGNLGWHTHTGHFNPLDFQGMIFRGCFKVGAIPIVPDWRIELTPANIAASIILKLAGCHKEGNKIFHIVQPEQVPWPQVAVWMDEVRADKKMAPLKRVEWGEWRALVAEASKTSVSTSKLMGLIDAFPGGGPEYLASQPLLACSPECLVDTSDRFLSSRSLNLFFSRANIMKMYSVESCTVGSNDSVTSRTLSAPRLLSGKVALITGASSGIGRGIAIALAQAGCNIALAARRMNELEVTRQQISDSCTNGTVDIICVPTDVTNRESVMNCVSITEDTLGSVDILVNSAGVMYYTLMKNVQWSEWERTIDVNCKGATYCIGAVLPQMMVRGSGHIINITSDAGKQAFPGLGVYSGSKFFVEGMSNALRLETASSGIRVTCIQPGNVATPLLATSTDLEGLELYGKPSGAKVLNPGDIGRAVVYAATQPDWCAVNQLLVEPREEPI